MKGGEKLVFWWRISYLRVSVLVKTMHRADHMGMSGTRLGGLHEYITQYILR